MDKDKLISKIKESNEVDEREAKEYMNSFVYTTLITQLLCIVFIIIYIIYSIKTGSNEKIGALLTLIFLQITLSEFYQFKMSKKKIHIVFFIIYLICTIFALILYFDNY